MQIIRLNMKVNGKYVSIQERRVEIGEASELRQMSLMASELLPELREENGLCTGRFHADIETESLDYASLSVGDILEFDDVRLQITEKGKRCFEDCPIRQMGQTCALPANIAFARIIQGGTLKIHASGTETFKV